MRISLISLNSWVAWKPWIAVILAVASLALVACQGSTPKATPPTTEIAIQQTATPNAPARTPTPAGTPIATATTAPTSSPSPIPMATAAPPPAPTQTHTAFQESPSVVIGDVRFGAEIANTPALRTMGLSIRPNLPAHTGMLFIFESGKASNFWMKEMRFPLDFVWIGADCTVVDVTENVPNPDSPTSPLPLYASNQPAAFNFEINGGEAKAMGLAIGDKVRFNVIDVEGARC